jgi:hypothetical protein
MLMPSFHERVRHALPRLTADNYRVTSPSSWEYNCIAWAAGFTDKWWWPAPGRYWPDGVPREETIAAFISAFATLGFRVVADAQLEAGLGKIVLYGKDGIATHAARQLATGSWTSKLGPSIDIEHLTPESVAGGEYGDAVAILGRPL